ncbi:MAG: glutamate-ammonia-ligase adenylyltransferase [Deltaproteobacteria bacterium]|nr:MAG: glutamate-ammonia-ligase adenylyltransferase [Deltaproteobacteria bacterium]
MPKPTFEEIKGLCPEIEDGIIRAHLDSLGDFYFQRFSIGEVVEHLKKLSLINPDHPLEIILEFPGEDRVECTVLAYDYPFEFSLITGVMAGMGFHIITGDIFTYEQVREETPPSRAGKRRGRLAGKPKAQNRRKIIDHFSGWVDSPFSFDTWAPEFKKRLEDVIRLLEQGDEESLNKAKHDVNELVVKRLSRLPLAPHAFLSPMEINIDNEASPYTRLIVISEDTPAFLYTLSNALSLQRVSIKHVKIRTINRRIEDEIDIVDSRERKIEDPGMLDQIRLSVLLTKQFTYFLGNAPDPYSALNRFEYIVSEIVRAPTTGKWLDLLSNPYTLQNLAKLLGTSDFLWEDFIRVQYEALLPLLKPHIQKKRFSAPMETLPRRLTEALAVAHTFEEKKRRLNEFKDREIFLIDLDHILNPDVDFDDLSKQLTHLAENVVRAATEMVYEHLAERFGRPMSVAGLEARYAVFGLGKLGGADLGYASDIELLFVYSDKGQTDGEKSITNTEFFELLVRETAQAIEAKREGIFQVDLRLRPHGNAGPLACSLERFCKYYGPGGPAHSYERLALVRLRAIAGDRDLGAQLERIRDEIVYLSKTIDLKELRELREKQFREKASGRRINAKFSPGGLVDIEYDVQILQVMYGKDIPDLRTPRMRDALRALAKAGVLAPNESAQLLGAYNFLRKLVNGMRMLRGSAKDLDLPDFDSDEFEHLARRIGYRMEGGLGPAQKLRIDIETNMAIVRAFVERHFGRESLPDPETGTVVDLVVSDTVPEDIRNRILSSYGFKDTSLAYRNLRSLAKHDLTGKTFIQLVALAFDILSRTPDPDMALNNWERFIYSLPSPEFHYKLYLSQPMRLEILLSIFSGSQFMADTLIRNPGFLDWLTVPENLHKTRSRKDLEDELRMSLESSLSHKVWLNRVRRIRRREILRIGTRDLYLKIPVGVVTLELSQLAEAIIQVCLEGVWKRLVEKKPEFEEFQDKFCVMALGKLGGRELNYSSDIDFVAVCDPGDRGFELAHRLATVMEHLRSDLSKHTEQGYLFRVDLRLRPYGESGELVSTIPGILKYYRDHALLWEIQAALKMRPVAGNLKIGLELMDKLRPIIMKRRPREAIVQSIEKMRKAAIEKSEKALGGATVDVKSGEGGVRDIEFLVQGLQLIYGADYPELMEGNTVKAIKLLENLSILPSDVASTLVEDYYFLRKIEHYLQILEDRQIHALPRDKDQLNALAKRVLGIDSNAAKFMGEVEKCLTRVRKMYVTYLLGVIGLD